MVQHLDHRLGVDEHRFSKIGFGLGPADEIMRVVPWSIAFTDLNEYLKL
jgi:hypothetical protein